MVIEVKSKNVEGVFSNVIYYTLVDSASHDKYLLRIYMDGVETKTDSGCIELEVESADDIILRSV